MLVLIIGSIFLGYFFHNLMISISNNFWVGSLYVLPKHFLLLDSDLVHPIIKNLPVILSLLSSFIAYIFLHYFTSYEGKNIFIIIFGFFYHAGGFNRIYNYSYLSIFKFSYVSVNKYLDKGLFEYFGPYGLYKFFRLMHKVIRDIWVTNILFNIFFMFLFMSLFILIFIFWLNIFFIALIANIGLLPIAIVIIYFLYDKDNLIIISV
jgi:hypothetical protein